jgi:hypothetical protein
MGIFERIRQVRADFTVARQSNSKAQQRNSLMTDYENRQAVQRGEREPYPSAQDIRSKREALLERFGRSVGRTVDAGRGTFGTRPKLPPLDLRGRAGVGPREDNETFRIRGHVDLQRDDIDIGDPAWLR